MQLLLEDYIHQVLYIFTVLDPDLVEKIKNGDKLNEVDTSTLLS